MEKLKTAAVLENLDAVTDFVDGQLEAMDWPMKAQMQLNVVIDELFSNIARYAYDDNPEKAREVEISVGKCSDPDSVLLIFEDEGSEFDPLKAEDPNTQLSAEERENGGLGIFLARKLTDRMEYARIDGKNILSVWKYLDPKTAGEKNG